MSGGHDAGGSGGAEQYRYPWKGGGCGWYEDRPEEVVNAAKETVSIKTFNAWDIHAKD